MKKSVLAVLLYLLVSNAFGQSVSSPDANLKVSVSVKDGKPVYEVSYKGKVMIESSPLGLVTNEGDFTTGMTYIDKHEANISKRYTQEKIKISHVQYTANELTCNF